MARLALCTRYAIAADDERNQSGRGDTHTFALPKDSATIRAGLASMGIDPGSSTVPVIHCRPRRLSAVSRLLARSRSRLQAGQYWRR